MKTNKIFSLAVLALLTAACSSDIAPEQLQEVSRDLCF